MGAPVLVIGLDAGCPGMVERWAADGTMPATAKLARRGMTAALEGEELLLEHGLWLSLFGGRARGESDRYSYRVLRPGSYEISVAAAPKPPPPPMLWDAPARQGRRVVLFDVPGVACDPGLPADQLAHWGVHEVAGQLASRPPDLMDEVRALGGRVELVRDHVETRDAAADGRFLDAVLHSVAQRGRIARMLVERGGLPDLGVVVFSESHTAGHRLWRHEHAGESAAPGLAGSLRSVYAAIDREIGALADLIGNDASVMVIAANGLEPRAPVDGLMVDFCRRLGYAPPPRVGARPVELAARLLPRRLRAAAGARLSRDTVERVIADRFRGSCDWERTRAFAIPDPFLAMLRVNLRGREPSGSVSPGADYDRAVAELESDLRALRDPRTGGPAIRTVARLRGADGGPPPRAPDLIGQFVAHEGPLRALEHPRATIRQPPPWWNARNGHAGTGALIAAGPGVPDHGRCGPLACTDVAPMIGSLI